LEPPRTRISTSFRSRGSRSNQKPARASQFPGLGWLRSLVAGGAVSRPRGGFEVGSRARRDVCLFRAGRAASVGPGYWSERSDQVQVQLGVFITVDMGESAPAGQQPSRSQLSNLNDLRSRGRHRHHHHDCRWRPHLELTSLRHDRGPPRSQLRQCDVMRRGRIRRHHPCDQRWGGHLDESRTWSGAVASVLCSELSHCEHVFCIRPGWGRHGDHRRRRPLDSALP
jgi:hypothetical protein